MIQFSCPECNRSLKVKPELAGRTGKCPGCGKNVLVPKSMPEPAAEEFGQIGNWPEDFPDLSNAVPHVTQGRGYSDSGSVKRALDELVWMPSTMAIIGPAAAGAACLLFAPVCYFNEDPRLPVLALPSLGLGILFLAMGLYFYLNYGPLVKLTRDGIYYSLVKRTVAWSEIAEVYKWNPYDDMSTGTKIVAQTLTKNRFGETFIKFRFNEAGRRRHKRLVHWSIDVGAHKEDDMVIPLSSIRARDLRVNLFDEINKRLNAYARA